MSMTAIALLAALSGAALQDQAEPRIERRSEVRIVTTDDGEGPGRLDANGDGEVTREEFSAPMGNAFDRLDANDDGKLSTEELASSRGGPDGPGRHIMMMGGPGGHGGPGGPGVRVFTSRLDGAGGHGGPGGPGVHVFTSRMEGPGGPGGAPGVMMFGGPDGPGGDAEVFVIRRGGPEGGPMPGESGQQVFVRHFGGPDGPGEMDKDGDGKVSQDEFLAPLREAFARMDSNSDGFLDDGEGRPTPPSED